METENQTEKTYNPDSDFSFSDEAKDIPLIPNGTYHGNVTSVTHDTEKKCFSWKVTLVNNGGFCTDDETAIDGASLTANWWLPKPGDESEMESSGRITKRQGKINRIQQSLKKMKITQDSIAELDTAIDNAEFLGMEVLVKLAAKEYNSVISNEIKDMWVE
jgi:hypothetical protein